MQKLIVAILMMGSLFIASASQAQFRKIPGVVTDSFKVKYPSAKSVAWKDNVTSFQATFTDEGETKRARYNSQGVWQQTEKKIKTDDIPAAVKDGLEKSKYSDWKINGVTHRELPGGVVEYILAVQNGTLNKRNLQFNSEGQLEKDGITL